MSAVNDYVLTDEIVHAREARLRTESSVVIEMLKRTNQRIKTAAVERKSQVTVTLFTTDDTGLNEANETFVHVLKQQGYVIEIDENFPQRIVVKW